MKIEDCTPGKRVQIVGKYMLSGLGIAWGYATIISAHDVGQEYKELPYFAYPYGMVKVQLDDDVEWGSRDPWIGPEDLYEVVEE